MALFARLEAATSRLEDIASSTDGLQAESNGLAGAALGSPGSLSATPEQAPSPPEPLPRSVEAFDKLVEEDVGAFVKASEKIGDLVEEQVCGRTGGEIHLQSNKPLGQGSQASIRRRAYLSACGFQSETTRCPASRADDRVASTYVSCRRATRRQSSLASLHPSQCRIRRYCCLGLDCRKETWRLCDRYSGWCSVLREQGLEGVQRKVWI